MTTAGGGIAAAKSKHSHKVSHDANNAQSVIGGARRANAK